MTLRQSENKAKGSFIVKNEKGLHTRPSTELVKCTVKYKAQVNLICQGNRVDGKSLLGILALAATKGTKIRIEAQGEEAESVITALVNLANNKFNINY